MLKFLIPRIALRDLPPMFVAGLLGSLIAGIYGILHDQITFTISPEYFTKLKFEQFRWANLSFHDRVFVAEIGFLATWWVGFFAGWFLARRHIPGQVRMQAWGKIMTGCGIIVLSAMLFGALGYAYGCWVVPGEFWIDAMERLGIADQPAFLRVAYIHNGSYLGGLIGLIVALACVHPQKA